MNMDPKKKKGIKLKALINQEQCSGCEICMAVCPQSCIAKIENEMLPAIPFGICEIIKAQCTGCKICAKDCPWEAIVMVMN